MNYPESGSFSPEEAANLAQPHGARPESAVSDDADPSSVFAILSRAILNQDVAPGTQTADSVFRAASDAARTLTEADGVALALRTADAVICRARSGLIAPGLGSKIEVGTGISGECLRTAEVLRCDDTETDSRVDPQICRDLGVRSMLAVPVRSGDGTAGILEAFSVRPFAFGVEHISLLARLAEIVEAAYKRELGVDRLAVADIVHPPFVFEEGPAELAEEAAPRIYAGPSVTSPVIAPPAKVERATAVDFPEARLGARRKFPFWIAGVAATVLITAAVVWMNWRGTDRDVALAEHDKTAQPPAVNDSVPAPMVAKPAAGTSTERPATLPANRIVQNAAQIEAEPTASNAPSTPDPAPVDTASGPVAPPQSSDAEPPSVTVTAENSPAELAKLTSQAADLPRLGTAVSEGVTEPTVLHRVLPMYPAGARSMRVEGSVVLDATIGEDGIPREIKRVSGSPLLAEAAAEAIRHWRYQPALLNGKAVALKERITVVFKVP